MFNGYNETPLISYNEFSQERGEKKQENVPKWSYGHDAGGQPAQPHSNNRHSEFWSGKPNFMGGIPNVLKCNCAGCYPSTENQSYQGDSTRHRPWLPRTFSVPPNGSNEPSKLPVYQWDNGLSNQGSCYSEGSLPYVQESGGKYAYYRHYQNMRLPEPNQPGVITTAKNGDYAKKPKNEMSSPIQNGGRQPVLCNPAYNLSKRVDGRNYCDQNEKYSNVASYSVDQQAPRLPVVEPFIKAVPSNLSQNRVPSTGYRSIKENMPQQYINSGYGDVRKIPESAISGDKRCEAFPAAQLQTGLHLDYSYLNRDLQEMEPQKMFFDNTRHPDYYSKNNFQDVIKRNSQVLDGRKDFAIHQMEVSEQHYDVSRSKYQEAAVSKPSYETFYSKDFEKSKQENHLAEDASCFQRNEDAKTENSSVHARLSRSGLLFNDPHYAERTQNSFPYQSNQAAYGNYLRSEYQGYNAQPRYKYPPGFQNLNQYIATAQQVQSCEQSAPPQGSGFIYDVHCQQNVDKTQQFCGGKNQSSVQTDSQPSESRKPSYLEAIRSEDVSKNGTSKISPLRLLRKKKFINVPQESVPVSTFDTTPGLDVRKFWSTWAEEEEENVAPVQMLVLDCQNIDPEQAKLLHLYETDPVRAVHLESGSMVIKNAVKEPVSQPFEETKACEQSAGETKVEEANLKKEVCIPEDREPEKTEEDSLIFPDSEKRSEIESMCPKTSPSIPLKKEKSEQDYRGKKKTEIMDKWTEKKFDFLKRAEESKAAEILRHEEEKKKIFETRLSLQQSLKKVEKCHVTVEESVARDRTSSLDEDCQSHSPESGNTAASELPTSEYRRNKFLDYSERKVIVNGKGEVERGETRETANETTETEEVKKEENLEPEYLSKWTKNHSTEKCSPTFTSKLKEEPAFEMDHILKKISEINFQNAEVKHGFEKDGIKKPRGPSTRKLKKKKLDHQPENEERGDKLMVETVSKPTIKFSIQKSHDLKISFKVLNSSNEYSDEEAGGGDADDKGNPNEDSKNSTELITLRYKSIQRDGDRKQNLDLKKDRRAFRRKKQTSRMKTPGLKFKKNRYEAQEERDPLADDGLPSNPPGKQYSDEYSTSDDFQVKETVDSAKIKLTFKRHKGNFETEYKINSNNMEKAPELDPLRQENDRYLDTTNMKCRKKSRTRKTENFPEPDYEEEGMADVGSGPEKVFLESAVEDSRNSSTSEDSGEEKENFELALSTLEFPPDTPLAGPAFSPSGEKETRYVIEDSKSSEKTNKCRPESGEFAVNHLIDCDIGSEGRRDEFSTSDYDALPEVNTKESSPKGEGLEKAAESEEEETQKISPDFIKSTKSQEIETNHKSRKTEETETVEDDAERVKGKNWGLESTQEVRESNFEENGDSGKTFGLEISEIQKNWEVCPEDTGDDDEPSESTAETKIPLDSENENRKMGTSDDRGEEEGNEALLFPEKSTEPFEKNANDAIQEPDEIRATELHVNCANAAETLAKNDSRCPFLNPEKCSASSESSPKEFLAPDDDGKKVQAHETQDTGSTLQKCSGVSENENGLLSFNDESSKNYVDVIQSESFEISEDFQQGNVPDLSPPEKSVSEGPGVSYDENHFLKEDDDTKKRDDEVGVSVSIDSKDAAPSDPGTDKLVQEEAEEAGGKIDEFSDLKTPFTDYRLSPIGCELEPPDALLANDSGCAECSFSPERTNEDKQEETVSPNHCVTEEVSLASRPELELEDGEIVDSADELTESFHGSTSQGSLDKFAEALKRMGFVSGEVKRRHSTDSKKRSKTPQFQTWARRKFLKTKSCPPELKYPEGVSVKEQPNISVEDIPLPIGPPPLNSCLNFKKYIKSNDSTEAKKERRESISTERQPSDQKEIFLQGSQPSCQSPVDFNNVQRPRNTSPLIFSKEPSSPLGIFQRSSKIKFSFSKRSKFSKLGLNRANDSKLETAFDTQSDESGKREAESPDFEKNKKIRTPEPEAGSSEPKLCNTEEVPNTADEKEEKTTPDQEDGKHSSNIERPLELLGEGLDEPVEAVPDFIRDEFYECEGLSTSEDLATGDDLELEKVNDDKFRDIMQNCIDNAKKFLSIGNLKLFSCSVDDLLEMDCRTTSAENETETNHIARDVLLTPCDDANDDLGLPGGDQPGDVSMDFGPSLSSEVCPEILPVDNWPYLEEEVPSSPTTIKEDENDLIPPLEDPSPFSTEDEFYPARNDAHFKSFRRRSLVSGEEALKLCSKIGTRRRNTTDCLRPFSRNFCDIKNEIMRLKREPREFEQNLKCRLSLKKLSNRVDSGCGFKNGRMRKFSEELRNGMNIKRAKGVNYKSPSWQPKVVLFRISKNEMRKGLKDSKAYKRFKSETSEDSPEAENSFESESETPKKRKPDFDVNPKEEMEKMEETLGAGNDKTLIRLPPLGSSLIKGSLMSTDPNKKKKKSRFRNLHTRRKSEHEARHSPPKQAKAPDVAEALLTKLFNDCDLISHSQSSHTKECADVKEYEENPNKKPNNKTENPSSDKRTEKNAETPRPCGRLKDESKEDGRREKSEKRHEHRDRRGERREGREHHKQRHSKHGECDGRRHVSHGSGRDRRGRSRRGSSDGGGHGRIDQERKETERRRSGNGEEERKKIPKDATLEAPWTCEVCGFNDPSERVVHIKSHSFHCQSCHLAFKTEAHFVHHLTEKHKDIRNQHHCLLCELSFDTEEQYQKHLVTREHRHLEAVEKNTINTLFTLLTGAPCPVLGIVEMKPEWLPNQAGTVHFYHQATPLSLALQYLKMHRDLSSLTAASSAHPG